MDEPLLRSGPVHSSTNNFEPLGGLIPIRPPLRKSEHPTFGLMSPRPRSGTSPMVSPRQSSESLFSFFLNKEQGRRTEKFYVPPSYETPYLEQHPPAQSSPLSYPASRKSPPPTSVSPCGSSLSSLFRIPEDVPTTGSHETDSGHALLKDLEAAAVEEQGSDHEWRETETVKNGSEHQEPCPESDHYLYPKNDEEDETDPLVPPPNIQGFDIKQVQQRRKNQQRKNLHKCKTAPVLSTVAGAAVTTGEPAADVKKKSSEISPTAIVWQAAVGLLVYLFVGVMIYCWKKEEFRGVETVGWIDALYFCIVTMCTIGYGDITPITPVAKILSCALVLVGFGFIDALMGGMVTFVLDRQEHLLMNVVLDGHHEVAKGYVLNAEKGTMRIRLKVFLAVGTVFGSIAVGTLFLHFVESLNWIDSVYVTVISVTTVGYGDYSFQTMWGRLFAAVWLLLSTLGVARAFLFLAEARVQKRQRHFAKRMLQRKMTAVDVMDADIDNDGHVRTLMSSDLFTKLSHLEAQLKAAALLSDTFDGGLTESRFEREVENFLAETRKVRTNVHYSKTTCSSLVFLSVAEFVVYKLKAMRKISKVDIVDIVRQFEELDTAGAGKISMTQLLEAEAEIAKQRS